jgi:hypothetical protein
MTTPLRPDDIHRTALLSVHDGSQPTLEAALAAHAATGVVLCGDQSVCHEITGQAALLTATVTAKRAFGHVIVAAAAPQAVITTGIFTGRTIADALTREGARLVTAAHLTGIDERWPVVLIGPRTPAPPQISQASMISRPVLRASWSGWEAVVGDSAVPAHICGGPHCVLAAIAAGALGISEAFGRVRSWPGSDAGFRSVTLNLWNPYPNAVDHGPAFEHAPCAWWLVGLGHLGQAYSWVISWLRYTDPSAIEIVLQDTDRTNPANYSTGVLTPEGSVGRRKTRIVAAALGHAGFDTRIIERRLGSDLRAAPAECHVALIGVDNLPTRKLTSAAGWPFAIDIGLGAGPDNFSSLLMRRFPGTQRSGQVTGWAQNSQLPVGIPASPAFTDLAAHHDQCGVVQLAGKAVGASFVGIVAACLGVAEASRELHGGEGHDIRTLDLTTMDSSTAPATTPANVVSAPIRRTT